MSCSTFNNEQSSISSPRGSRYRLLALIALVMFCVAGLGWLVLHSGRGASVVFSNGSSLSVRKVSCGKNNEYYHHPIRRAAAAVMSDSTWDRAFARWFSKVGVTSVNSCIRARDDHLVVFGDFSFVPGGDRFWEFTGVDADGNESGPLEAPLLEGVDARIKVGPCILAYGTNVPNGWPIAVRVYERETNGTRKLLANVPAERARR